MFTMHSWIKRLAVLGLASAMVVIGFGVQNSTASAYGAADGPIRQIEFSGNCDNPTVEFCNEVGLGGIWLWIEIDQAADGSLTADISGSGCDHSTRGEAGAISIRGTNIQVETYDTLAEALANATNPQPLPGIDFNPDTNQPLNGPYYAVPIPGPIGETLIFPQSVGHYGANLAPGVTLQLQVAP